MYYFPILIAERAHLDKTMVSRMVEIQTLTSRLVQQLTWSFGTRTQIWSILWITRICWTILWQHVQKHTVLLHLTKKLFLTVLNIQDQNTRIIYQWLPTCDHNHGILSIELLQICLIRQKFDGAGITYVHQSGITHMYPMCPIWNQCVIVYVHDSDIYGIRQCCQILEIRMMQNPAIYLQCLEHLK